MTFVSYAQNFEDVMLWRALKHVENGFYIDVGANDPVIDSVTKAFYDRGWHGINIEPLSSHHKTLVEERTRDINLLCAAGSISGEIELWECDVRGWATAAPEVIAQHSANGYRGNFLKVPVTTLTDICAAHAPDEVQFLKVDVEGFEKSVIDGMDFSRFRPWILVIEATRPSSTEEVYKEWEDTVLSANYLPAYSDGVNRFYVAAEHPELRHSLRYPPNIFDDFIRFEQLNSEEKAQQAEAKARRTEAAANHALTQLHAVHASASWRITAPLRFFAKVLPPPFRRLRVRVNQAIRCGVNVFQALLARLMSAILRRPRLSERINRCVMRFPRLHQQLLEIAHRHGVVTEKNGSLDRELGRPSHLGDLSPRAREIYRQLQRAIEKRKEGR